VDHKVPMSDDKAKSSRPSPVVFRLSLSHAKCVLDDSEHEPPIGERGKGIVEQFLNLPRGRIPFARSSLN
jgi:hypothetical protein